MHSSKLKKGFEEPRRRRYYKKDEQIRRGLAIRHERWTRTRLMDIHGQQQRLRPTHSASISWSCTVHQRISHESRYQKDIDA